LAEAPSPFPGETAWSTIIAARDRASPEWRARLGRLVSAYWRPVFWHLQRRWKLSPEDAADLAQDFFAKLLQGDALGRASPERGRFRTFLKMQLRDLVVDEIRRRLAQKRGGGEHPVPLDADGGEPESPGADPEEAFDRDWAACLLQDSIRSLETSFLNKGKDVVYRAFQQCVLLNPPKSYRECAKLLGVKESDVRNYVYAARGELRDIVRAGIRDSLAREPEVDTEFAYLMELFER
jgi:RNA polymerase sigma-70 factor (ECF subfamily)